MKQLTFIIGGQELTRTDTLEIVSDAIGQFEAVFTFDDWWNGYTPTAQFTKDGKTIDCILENNRCIVPPEALQNGGVFYVSVFSTVGTGNRKTANEVAVPLKPSGYKKDGSHSVDPTPTVYEQLLKKIDESTVINGDGVVASPNADFAEVAEWSDGNPDGEDRIGYFVCFDVPTSGIIMRKANADDDVKGITVANPSFAGNCTKDKFDENGKLLPQYEYVGVIGLVPVHDNGQCVVGERCIPADGGLAAPSPNDKGYQVVERYNENMILVAIEPNGDMVYRLQEQIDNAGGIKEITEDTYVHELDVGIYSITCETQEYMLHIDANDMYAPIIDGLIIVNYIEELNALQWQCIGMNAEYSNGMFIGYTDKESGDCYEYLWSSNFESVDNRVTNIKGIGSNVEYPTTRAVYDFVINKKYETIYDITLEEETDTIRFNYLNLKEVFIGVIIPPTTESIEVYCDYTKKEENMTSGKTWTKFQTSVSNNTYFYGKIFVEPHCVRFITPSEATNELNLDNVINLYQLSLRTPNSKFPIGTKVILEGMKA